MKVVSAAIAVGVTVTLLTGVSCRRWQATTVSVTQSPMVDSHIDIFVGKAENSRAGGLVASRISNDFATGYVTTGQWVEVKDSEPLILRFSDEPLLSKIELSTLRVTARRPGSSVSATKCSRLDLIAAPTLTFYTQKQEDSTKHPQEVFTGAVESQADGEIQLRTHGGDKNVSGTKSFAVTDVEQVDAALDAADAISCELAVRGRWWVETRFQVEIGLMSNVDIELVAGVATINRSWMFALPRSSLHPVTSVAIRSAANRFGDPIVSSTIPRDGSEASVFLHANARADLMYTVRSEFLGNLSEQSFGVFPTESTGAYELTLGAEFHDADVAWLSTAQVLQADGGSSFHPLGTVSAVETKESRTRLKLTTYGSSSVAVPIDHTYSRETVSARGESTWITSVALQNRTSAPITMRWISIAPSRDHERAKSAWFEKGARIVSDTTANDVNTITIELGPNVSTTVGLNWRQKPNSKMPKQRKP
jgi:hypothetical protein